MKYYTITQNTNSSIEFQIHLNNIRNSFINNHFDHVYEQWMKLNGECSNNNIIIQLDFNELKMTDIIYLNNIYRLFIDSQTKYPRKQNVYTSVYLKDCSTIAQLFVDMVIKIVSRNSDVNLLYIF